MSGDGNFKWWVGLGGQPESFQGPFDTREEAVEVGWNDHGNDGEDFTICEADKSVVRSNIRADFLAETIIEDLGEHNDECWGDDGWDEAWDEAAITDLERRLEDAVEQWLKAHPGKTRCFGTMRNEQTFAGKVAPPAGGPE